MRSETLTERNVDENILPLLVTSKHTSQKLECSSCGRNKSRLSNSCIWLKMVLDKMGTSPTLPDVTLCHSPGKQLVFPSTSIIDNQPTIVIRTIASNNLQVGTWALVIQPQLKLVNVLPCGIEYMIVQARDCPSETLDPNGQFIMQTSWSSKRRQFTECRGLFYIYKSSQLSLYVC
jgi:hypothetical protein